MFNDELLIEHNQLNSIKPMISQVITIKDFDFNIENTTIEGQVTLNEKQDSTSIKKVMSRFFGDSEEIFSYACVNPKEMDDALANPGYHMPHWISFYDDFASKQFAALKLNEKIELVELVPKKNEKVSWREIPRVNKPITNKKILKKMERSFLKLKEIREGELKERNKGKEERKAQVDQLPLLSSKQKNAYKELAGLCLNETDAKMVHSSLEGIRDFDGDDEHYTTLNYINHCLSEKDEDLNFINDFDWKYATTDFAWIMPIIMKRNFNVVLNFPTEEEVDENSSISFDGVFEAFNNVLKENGFQMGFIEQSGDNYIILIHKLEDYNTVKKNVELIGYKYSTVD